MVNPSTTPSPGPHKHLQVNTAPLHFTGGNISQTVCQHQRIAEHSHVLGNLWSNQHSSSWEGNMESSFSQTKTSNDCTNFSRETGALSCKHPRVCCATGASLSLLPLNAPSPQSHTPTAAPPGLLACCCCWKPGKELTETKGPTSLSA